MYEGGHTMMRNKTVAKRCITFASIAAIITWFSYTVYAVDSMWSPRYGHESVIFDDKMWVVGGSESTITNAEEARRFRNDVWSSYDGRKWICENANAPWIGRSGFGIYVFRDRLWLAGGYNPFHKECRLDVGYRDDIWSSKDGIGWQRSQSCYPQWSARSRFSSVVYDKRIWVIGGTDSKPENGYRNDVFATDTGEVCDWHEVAPHAPFASCVSRPAFVFHDKLWIINGLVYSTIDGRKWDSVSTKKEACLQRGGQKAIVHSGFVWVSGGMDNDEVRYNDVWRSKDAITWEYVVKSAPWPPRAYHTMVSFKGKLWIMGGLTDQPANDIWNSEDGINWQHVEVEVNQ